MPAEVLVIVGTSVTPTCRVEPCSTAVRRMLDESSMARLYKDPTWRITPAAMPRATA